MNLKQNEYGEYVTEDELVSVYQCDDGTWRVAYFPFADKDRNLTKEQAMAMADQRHKELAKAFEDMR